MTPIGLQIAVAVGSSLVGSAIGVIGGYLVGVRIARLQLEDQIRHDQDQRRQALSDSIPVLLKEMEANCWILNGVKAALTGGMEGKDRLWPYLVQLAAGFVDQQYQYLISSGLFFVAGDKPRASIYELYADLRKVCQIVREGDALMTIDPARAASLRGTLAHYAIEVVQRYDSTLPALRSAWSGTAAPNR